MFHLPVDAKNTFLCNVCIFFYRIEDVPSQQDENVAQPNVELKSAGAPTCLCCTCLTAFLMLPITSRLIFSNCKQQSQWHCQSLQQMMLMHF